MAGNSATPNTATQTVSWSYFFTEIPIPGFYMDSYRIVPSGLDCNTGRPANVTTRADLTVTFAANKIGFTKPEAEPYVGQVAVYDIGAPRTLIDRIK